MTRIPSIASWELWVSEVRAIAAFFGANRPIGGEIGAEPGAIDRYSGAKPQREERLLSTLFYIQRI